MKKENKLTSEIRVHRWLNATFPSSSFRRETRSLSVNHRLCISNAKWRLSRKQIDSIKLCERALNNWIRLLMQSDGGRRKQIDFCEQRNFLRRHDIQFLSDLVFTSFSLLCFSLSPLKAITSALWWFITWNDEIRVVKDPQVHITAVVSRPTSYHVWNS